MENTTRFSFTTYDRSTGLIGAAHKGDVSTQTIDLDSLFTADVHSTGTFDFSGIESTSFGKLLNAIPIPAMLLDQWYTIVFVNSSCGRIGTKGARTVGSCLTDLLSVPRTPSGAEKVCDRALSLLERTFSTRKPQVAEAILEIGQVKLWARLHLRSVRMATQRYVLLLIEDVTSEKMQSRLSQREEQRIRKIHQDCTTNSRGHGVKLRETEEKLRETASRYLAMREQLQQEKSAFMALFLHAPVGMALIREDGSFQEINPTFTEVLGYDLNDLPHARDWIRKAFPNSVNKDRDPAEWLEFAGGANERESPYRPFTVTCKDGTERFLGFQVQKLENGRYLLTCRKLSRDDAQTDADS